MPKLNSRRPDFVAFFLLCSAAAMLGCGEPQSAAPVSVARADEPPRPAPANPSAATNSPAAANSSTGANAWPAWRGARSDGLAASTTFPEKWPISAPPPRWRVPTSEGWSSPVVADGRVFLTDRTGDKERTAAFDADSGKLLWEQTSLVDFDPHPVGRRHGNGPKSTPVVDDGRVFSLGIAGRLQCFAAADGKLLWSHNFPAEFAEPEPLPRNRAFVNAETNVIVPIAEGKGAPVPLFGYTGSLTHDGRLLIAAVGGSRGGTIMAFDKTSGAVVWKALEENVSYSSPITVELAGRRQVVAMTGPRVVGLDASNGSLLWSFPYQNQYDESIGTPVIAGDLVIVTAVGRPLTAHRVAASGERWTVADAWTNEDVTSYLSSMLAFEGHVYGMNDGGEWHCLRATDGATQWRGGNHGYYSTPVLVDRRILGLNERGELTVFAADPTTYKTLAFNALITEPTWTSPAVVGNRLYVRGKTSLACFEIR